MLGQVAERLLAQEPKRSALPSSSSPTARECRSSYDGQNVRVKLRFKDRLRLKLLGTVSIELFRLDAGRAGQELKAGRSQTASAALYRGRKWPALLTPKPEVAA